MPGCGASRFLVFLPDVLRLYYVEVIEWRFELEAETIGFVDPV